MPAEVLLDREVHVDYGQFYVCGRTASAHPDPAESFRGQVNGLCGAANGGTLFLMTGTHLGRVGCIVELHLSEPALTGAWEDAVEASFAAGPEELYLTEWGGGAWYPLALPAGGYRVRYSARGMDEARLHDRPGRHEPPWDCYLLQFWPAAPAADRVLRETSSQAAYWNGWARSLSAAGPAVPRPRRETTRQSAADRRRWGDRVPNQRLRRVQGNVLAVERLDMDLVFALAEAGDDTDRAVARWAAEKACEAAGLIDLPWVTPALDALREGRPLPHPFDDMYAVWPHLETVRTTTVRSYDGRHPRVSQQHSAVPALFATAEPDALRAALDAVYAAVVTYGRHYRTVLAELRMAFPQLGEAATVEMPVLPGENALRRALRRVRRSGDYP